jgi:hypothetical protein
MNLREWREGARLFDRARPPIFYRQSGDAAKQVTLGFILFWVLAVKFKFFFVLAKNFLDRRAARFYYR